MTQPGREWIGNPDDEYRFAFNGKEKDDEIKGNGNSYDFGARMHDPRLGRFFSLDPKFKDYPNFSPYLYAANNPIFLIDFNGEGPQISINDVIAAFNDGKKAVSYSITLYVDQPVSGSTEGYDKSLTGIDTGHTFIKLSKVNEDGSIVERIVGFYPAPNDDEEIASPNNPEVTGEFKDNSTSPYDLKISYGLDEEQFKSVLDYIEKSKDKRYNLNSYNCTTFGIECVQAAGIEVPDNEVTTEGTFILGYGNFEDTFGNNPGQLGEDLRKNPNTDQTPGNAKNNTNENTTTEPDITPITPTGRN